MILLREEGESSRETNLSGQPLETRRKETEREIKKGKKVYTRNAIIGRRPEGANGIKPAFPYSWPISCVVLLLLPLPPSLWTRRYKRDDKSCMLRAHNVRAHVYIGPRN